MEEKIRELEEKLELDRKKIGAIVDTLENQAIEIFDLKEEITKLKGKSAPIPDDMMIMKKPNGPVANFVFVDNFDGSGILEAVEAGPGAKYLWDFDGPLGSESGKKVVIYFTTQACRNVLLTVRRAGQENSMARQVCTTNYIPPNPDEPDGGEPGDGGDGGGFEGGDGGHDHGGGQIPPDPETPPDHSNPEPEEPDHPPQEPDEPDTVPNAPSDLVATPVSVSRIDLSWVDNSDNETGFSIQRCTGNACSGFVEIDTVAAGVTTYQNTGLTASTIYRYRVIAQNAEGDSFPSGTVTAATLAPALNPPVAPSNPTATANGQNQVTLTWQDNSNNEDNFSIERCTGSGCTGFSVLASPAADAQSYVDTGLTAGTTYRYRIRAQNADGNSAYTAIVTVTTAAIPPVEQPPTQGVSFVLNPERYGTNADYRNDKYTDPDNPGGKTFYAASDAEGDLENNVPSGAIAAFSLNTTPIPGMGVNRTLRYSYKFTANPQSLYVLRGLIFRALPGFPATVQEFWWEQVVCFSANFGGVNDPNVHSDHKVLFAGTNDDESGRGAIYAGTYGPPWAYGIEYPYQTGIGFQGMIPLNKNENPTWTPGANLYTGTPKIWRGWWRHSTTTTSLDGGAKFWQGDYYNGTISNYRLLHSASAAEGNGFNTAVPPNRGGGAERWADWSYCHNKDQAEIGVLMHVDWGVFKLLLSNPGW